MSERAFDLRALYDALDAQRRARDLSWTAVASEINARCSFRRPIALSTITGLKSKPQGEGDGILQMLVWLGRTPESFVPGAPRGGEVGRFPDLAYGQILRWDTRALFAAVAARRESMGLSWAAVAEQIPGFTSGMLRNLSKGGRIGFPRVMRLVGWLEQPAVDFTRIDRW